MKRKHICDVKGCGRQRLRYQRLCPRCFSLLPGAISRALILAWRSGDRPAWRARCDEAGKLVGHREATSRHRLADRSRRAPIDGAALMNRILGERPDA
ncbi:MAG: hypothetical protein WBL20_19460 [Sphingobium sp.]|uniref:hypothetical protein n=1 Tax=Sphingobium sp. TaxID=1912891 RepID=UPI003BB17D56